MTQEHPFLDDLPAYALGALEAEAAQALERHLRTCEACRAELASYRTVREGLLMAVPPAPPPVRLRGELQRQLSRHQKALPRRSALSLRWSALALVILLLLLNIYSILQVRSLRREQAGLARRVETGQSALAMLAAEGTQSIHIQAGNVSGTLLLNRGRDSALLILWNLPALDPEQTYQAWLIDSQGQRTSAGIFQGEAQPAYIAKQLLAGAALSNFVGLGVTVEPAGGSPQPTGRRVFKIDF